jgi:UDP-N-acetylmuramoyl-L-alanyl-D-glutamate--2,6-diaminopimelate ligase
MKIENFLFDDVINFFGDKNTIVSGVSYNSKIIYKNYVFFALPGFNTNGNKYVFEAIKNGASVIVSEIKHDKLPVAHIVVKNIFRFMASFCSKFYCYPNKKLKIIGITGTNGKTTITYIVENILLNYGIECGIIGTINYRYKNKIFKSLNTTPQSLDIYRFMKEIVDCGIKYLIMEVSSHSLSLDRVYGINFYMAVFTNLTQEHIDFHGSLENYFKAKANIFKNLNNECERLKKYAIINIDDEYGRKLLKKYIIKAEIKKYSIFNNIDISDFKAENIETLSCCTKFDLIHDNKRLKIHTKYIGLHNVYNSIAAFAIAFYIGVPINNIIDGLNNSNVIPGRLEKIDTFNLGFDVFIDYAHTDDALYNVLNILNKNKKNRIITVIGCGGNRDRIKRPLIGKVAVENSDFVFITSDNPRDDDPNEIILDIEVGIKRIYKNNYKVEINRENAIKNAIIMADENDIVLIAGKGHEKYQIIGTKRIYFDDIEVAKKYINLKQQKKYILKQKEFMF